MLKSNGFLPVVRLVASQHTATTHCNNTLQQHTATTHCHNTQQQHTATTHCNNTLQQHTAATHCCNTLQHTAPHRMVCHIQNATACTEYWEDRCLQDRWYGVATISRLLKIKGLFCKRALSKRLYSAKETCNLGAQQRGAPRRSCRAPSG